MVAYQVGDPMTEDGLKKAKACVESQLPWEFQVVHTSYGERTVHTTYIYSKERDQYNFRI